ncbi:MAG: response regulator [Comamonadaceae bacterium]
MPKSNRDFYILLVEDSADDAVLIDQELERAGIAKVLLRVDSADALAHALKSVRWDVVLSDYFLPGFSGTQSLRQVRAHSVDTPFILVSGYIGEEEAVALMKEGANDYVMKDRLARLGPALQRSVSEAYHKAQARDRRLALRESEERLQAIVSNVPGMVFELEFKADGSPTFNSVSDGCQDLLGARADALQQDADVLLSQILTNDRASFMAKMMDAHLQHENWSWVGRVRMAQSGQIKWLDLRARVRRRLNLSDCWDGLILDVTRSKTAELEVRRAHEDLARLSAHVEGAKEQERSNIAREIHDELGGSLTAIKIMLSRHSQELTEGKAVSSKALLRLQAAEELLNVTMVTTRRIATSLRPAVLDVGIVAAIEWQASEFEKRMEVICRVTCAVKEIELDDTLAIALFRTFQEALTNVVKHSGATRVDVELEANRDSVTLQVHDNGSGISSEDLLKAQSYGILGMRERARNLGGEATVRKTRSGTAVMLRMPRSLYTSAKGSAAA